MGEECCGCGPREPKKEECCETECTECSKCGKPIEDCECPCEECGKPIEDCECEPEDVEELAEYADDKVDALINLLIKKGVFTADEFQKEFDDLFEQVEEENKEHPRDPIAN
ncbi:MAG: hypothetical protein ABIG89_05295 [Candidatus Woesearchaeota archaeon]